MSQTAEDRIAQLEAMIARMAEAQGQTTAPPEEDVVKAQQFSSLGFVVIGKGTAPIEGQLLQVPVKSGKVVRVRALQRIDTAPFNGEFGDWAFTYKRLKRGES